jgi:hypothetical protein
MSPDETHQRAVRIKPLVGMLMMPPAHRDPTDRRILQGATAEHGEGMFKPFRTPEAAMRQKPVIAETDTERTSQEDTDDSQRHAGPTEEPGQQRKQGKKMIAGNKNRRHPLDPNGSKGYGRGQRHGAFNWGKTINVR